MKRAVFLVAMLLPTPMTSQVSPGDSICYTTLDSGGFGSPRRSIVNYGDGHLSVARMHHDGTHYACTSDAGASWTGCTTIQGGGNFASIDKTSTIDRELVLMGPNGTLASSERCVNSWGLQYPFGAPGLFPRFAHGALQRTHLIKYLINSFVLVYIWTDDEGQTVSGDRILCTGSGFISPDGYDIAASGNTVVVVCAGNGRDVILAQSLDGGWTWTEQVIHDVDDEYLTPGELIPDGACSVVLDQFGKAHVAWSSYSSNGDGTFGFSREVGIIYWSEATGATPVATPIQDTTICEPIGRNGNYASRPDIGVDLEGNPYIVFSQVIVERDTYGNCYEHLYSVGSVDGGSTWGNQVDITPGNGFDAAVQSLADHIDDDLHLVYNSDPYAGNSSSGNHDTVEVAVKYLSVPKQVVVGINGEEQLPFENSLNQNYPNPFNPMTEIGFTLLRSSEATLTIYTLLGEEVRTLVQGLHEAGTHTVTWDASGHPSGVYFYRLEAGNFRETRKLVLVR